MPYYYKRPGDWLWKPHETDSLAEDVSRGRLRADWQYRVEGDDEEHSLAELLEAERVRKSRPLTPTEEEMTAPDGAWGWIVVVACSLLLLLVIFVPARQGASGSGKFYLGAIALFWLGWGIQQIRAAREWRAHHRPRPNHAMQRTPTRHSPHISHD
jgi:hypothetical protein